MINENKTALLPYVRKTCAYNALMFDISAIIYFIKYYFIYGSRVSLNWAEF